MSREGAQERERDRERVKLKQAPHWAWSLT